MKMIYLFLVLGMLSCTAQKNDGILYILPDSVEAELDKQLSNSGGFAYLILFDLGNYYELFVENDNDHNKRSYSNMISSSRRKVPDGADLQSVPYIQEERA